MYLEAVESFQRWPIPMKVYEIMLKSAFLYPKTHYLSDVAVDVQDIVSGHHPLGGIAHITPPVPMLRTSGRSGNLVGCARYDNQPVAPTVRDKIAGSPPKNY